MTAEPHREPRWLGPAHVLALAALAVTQPLLDLLAKNPEIFVARHLQAGAVAGLVGALYLGLPASLAALAEVVGLAGARARRLAYAAIVAALGTLLAALAVGRLPAPAPGRLALATLLGVGLAVLREGRRPVRELLTVLAALSPAVPLGFALADPVRAVLRPPTVALAALEAPRIERPVPVVIVVLDELPVSTVMTSSGEVDAARFPNLARVAATSTWYPNTSTSGTLTLTALPAILTGRYTRPGDPTPAFPAISHSLFTLLGRHYRHHVLEPRSDLEPAALTAPERADAGVLARDLAVVYLHLVAPPEWARHLPSITTNWDRFGLANDRAEAIRRHVATIPAPTPGDPPLFDFLHSELPHHPWMYLPSGKRYFVGHETYADGLVGGGGPAADAWTNEPTVVAQAYQRHLLQAVYADRLLGEMIDRLEALGLFSPALLVVTADHGVSFRPGMAMRMVTAINHTDVIAVPLFVKLPGQTEKAIDPREAQLVDLVPTVAEVLGATPSWELDGRSLLGEPGPPRPRYVFHNSAYTMVFDDPALPAKLELAATKERLFGRDLAGVYRYGPFPELLGREVAELPQGEASPLAATLERPQDFDAVDPASGWVPAQVRGVVAAASPLPGPAELAVAVRGRIAATTRSWLPDPREGGREARFTAMVPEEVLAAGANRVELFEVRRDDAGPTLLRLGSPSAVLRLVAGDARLEDGEGRSFEVVPGRYAGEVRDFLFRGRAYRVQYAGWAAGAATGRPPREVVLLLGGVEADRARVGDASPSLWFPWRDRERQAFELYLPTAQASGEVRFFALGDDGVASELPYTLELQPRDFPTL